MQGKGIVKFFLVVVTLFCLLQYFYMYPTLGVEKDARAHAQSISGSFPAEIQAEKYADAESAYLDSMSSEVIFNVPMIKQFTYEDLKNAQLAYGLDLKGGMNVVLQVDLNDFIKSLAENDAPLIKEALLQADADVAVTKSDYVTRFYKAYKALGGTNLAAAFDSDEVLRENIKFDTPDGEVVRILQEKSKETVGLTYKRLKERIDELGVIQPNVSLDEARDLIIVELPGIRNPERARNFLQTTAELQFWNIYRITDNVSKSTGAGIIQLLAQADDKLRRLASGDTSTIEAAKEVIRMDTTYVYDSEGNIRVDTFGPITEVYADETTPTNRGPLLSALTLNGAGADGGALMPFTIIGTAPRNQIKTINDYLARPEVVSLMPKDISFKWSHYPANGYNDYTADSKVYELYAIKMERGSDKPPLAGDMVTDAAANPDPSNGSIAVSLGMTGPGAKIWGEMTTKAAQDNNREIAIVLDDKVVSAPRVINPILTGNSSITGDYSMQEGEDLAKILQIGKLPAKTKIIQESLVGPSLGADNIRRSINSLLIGFGLVFLFMVFYYGAGGFVAILALFLNIFFIFGLLANFGTVLTLPGIAGIVLTIGMAVDANVIIFERIREELRAGKSLLVSIKDGFQHSYSAIIDANVTTILVAIILAYFGMGPIKGFAIVLIIGVCCSLFTAVLVGRMLIDWWTITKGNDLSFWTGPSKNAFANLNIDWLGKRKMAYVLSSIIIIIGLGSFAMRGFELGVDFKGGYSYNVQFDKNENVDLDGLRSSLGEAFGMSTLVKEVSTSNTFNVVTSYNITDGTEGAAEKVMAKLHEGVNAATGGSISLDQFKQPDGLGTHVVSSSKVGPTIAEDIKESSLYATIFALLVIFLYIFIRFNKWQYSAGAVAALFHDTLIVLSLFSIFHGVLPFSMEINQAFIAAILTVIGYSINDTVVVFDRIREFMNNYTKKSKHEVINMSINSTVSRTVITSMTTLFVVAILLFFGGSSIKGFAFALFIGVIVGTYSSIFIATPIMSDLTGDFAPKTSKKKSSFAKSKVN